MPVIDPDDLIFPRTATRHGPKYQANVPAAPELDINPSGTCLFYYMVHLELTPQY